MDRDPYLWPDVDVLRNKLGLKDQRRLDEAEREFTWVRQDQIVGGVLGPRAFDAGYLKAVHGWLFRDVYDWAGEFRKGVDLGKEPSQFLSVSVVPSAVDTLFADLHEGPLLDGPRVPDEAFLRAATKFLSDLNFIHPFREGNGRTQRVFLNLIAVRSGRMFDWRQVTEAENVKVSIEDFHSPGKFRGLLERVVRPATALSNSVFGWQAPPTPAKRATTSSAVTALPSLNAGHGSGTCPLCGRLLTSPKSIERGYGRGCWRRLRRV